MGLAKKGRAPLVVGDRLFLWYVTEGDNGSSWGPILHVISDDKRFAILCSLDQPDPPFVVVMGREFPGLPDAGGGWTRVRCPRLVEPPWVTPGAVRRLIDWCLDADKPIVRVDYRGRPLEPGA